jgi:hypothetical protein
MYQPIRLTLFSAVAAAMLASGCAVLPVSEEFQTDAAGNAVAANTDGRPVRECRWAKATGTKMRSRICYSQEEWAQIDAATAEDQETDDFFRRSRENSAVTGNVPAPPTGGGSL